MLMQSTATLHSKTLLSQRVFSSLLVTIFVEWRAHLQATPVGVETCAAFPSSTIHTFGIEVEENFLALSRHGRAFLQLAIALPFAVSFGHRSPFLSTLYRAWNAIAPAERTLACSSTKGVNTYHGLVTPCRPQGRRPSRYSSSSSLSKPALEFHVRGEVAVSTRSLHFVGRRFPSLCLVGVGSARWPEGHARV